MADFQATPDLNKFLIKVFKATELGLIQWEKTADEAILTAPIEGEHNLLLSEVPNFNDQEGSDYTLSLLKGRQSIFVIDYRNFHNLSFSSALGEKYAKPWDIFKNLWINSYLKAHKISDELKVANILLDKILPKEEKK